MAGLLQTLLQTQYASLEAIVNIYKDVDGKLSNGEPFLFLGDALREPLPDGQLLVGRMTLRGEWNTEDAWQ